MPGPYARLAPALLAQGFEPIPVRGKIPDTGYIPDTDPPVPVPWQSVKLTEERVTEWAANGRGNHSVGLRCGPVSAVDIDIYDPEVAQRVADAFTARFGAAPCRIGRAPKRLFLYAPKTPSTKLTSAGWTRPNPEEGEKENRVEVLGVGQQFVAYGIHPDTRKPYAWEGAGEPATAEVWELPLIDLDEVAAWLVDELPKLIPPDWTRKTKEGNSAAVVGTVEEDEMGVVQLPIEGLTLEMARQMFDKLDPSYADGRAQWLGVGMALHHQFGQTEDDEAAFEMWDTWSQSCPTKYEAGQCQLLWADGFKKERGNLQRVVTMASFKVWIGDEAWADIWGRARTELQEATVADLRARLQAATTEAEIRGPIAEDIRVADLAKFDRNVLVDLARQRLRGLIGVLPSVKSIRDLFAPEPPGYVPQDAGELGFAGPEWAQEWVWVGEGQGCYINRKTLVRCGVTSFNAMHARHTGDLMVGDRLMEPHRMMTDVWRAPPVQRLMYLPTAGEVFRFEGVLYLNTFRRDLIVRPANAPSKLGHRLVSAIKRHLKLLIPDERERALVLYWMAFNYCNPGRKIRWAPVIKGCEGDGKSLLLGLLSSVLGDANTNTVNGDTVLNSSFTGWSTGQCVTMIEEVRFRGHNRHEVANRLKPFITNDRIEWHGKGMDPVPVINTTNYILVTNHEDMLPLTETDRRYLVIHSPWGSKAELETELELVWGMGYTEHFRELYEPFKTAEPEARAQLALWFTQVVKTPPAEFDPDGTAPETAAKRRTIEAGIDEVVLAAREVIEDGHLGVCKDVIVVKHLIEVLKRDKGYYVDQPRRFMRELGYVSTSGNADSVPRVKWRNGNDRVWVLPSNTKKSHAWLVEKLNATQDEPFEV